MWKWVIRDYFAAFRWEKVKVWLKRGSWWGVLYLGVFFPVWLCSAAEVSFWKCLLLYWSLLFGLISAGLHPDALSKIMFLCPMNREKRMQYIARSYLFRMMMMTGMGVFAIGILLVLGITRPLMALLYVWNVWILSVLLCGLCNAKVSNQPETTQALVLNLDGVVASANMIVAILAMFFIMVMTLSWDKEGLFWGEVIFGAIAVLVQLPLIIQLLKKWKDNIERVASYERID